MDLGIAGRKALLFGASRGMGRACAMQLAREGVDVTLVARTEGPLTEAATAIRTACLAARVTAVVGDLTRPEGRAAALEACPAPLSRFRSLNASFLLRLGIADLTFL